MLARTELSAEELGISEAERSSLIKLRGMLERGELQDTDHSQESFFNMQDWGCCFHGHANRLADEPVFTTSKYTRESNPGPAHPLFSMAGRVTLRSPTIEEAAAKLSEYLATGNPCW